jgi:DNA topoisomerase-6 subunit B
MYGVLTTGKPVKIISKTGAKQKAHYFELQIDTKRNHPEITNGKGEGVDIEPGEKGHKQMLDQGIDWAAYYPAEEGKTPQEVKSGTRVTIEIEAKYIRGRGSVDEYLEQTAIANPHVTIHYKDPEGQESHYNRSTTDLPAEPKEIKPHPYGVELGRLMTMLQDNSFSTITQFLTESFSRVSNAVASNICEAAKISSRAHPKRIGRQEADALYQAIQKTKISAPSTDCLCPIGEPLILKGLAHVVPGQFYTADTRPPAVYRGNPFQIEVGLAFGGGASVQKVSLEALIDFLAESDARTIRQFLMNTFDGVGGDGADKIIAESKIGTRQSPGKLDKKEIAQLHAAMKNVNLSEGQTMQVMRYANRVPLQFSMSACAITQAVMGTNWRAYGLNQSRGSLPTGPVSVMVHMASVWVPFTSESKEAIAGYPEIQKELRLGLQAVGRRLQMYLNARNRVKQEGERRSIFLRYLNEVAGAVSSIKEYDDRKKKDLYEKLLLVAKKKTAEADTKLDERGKKVQQEDQSLTDDGKVLIVAQEDGGE